MAAKSGDFDQARELMEEGDNHFSQGHHVHAKLIQQEASGETPQMHLLLIHAEDQMMPAETLRIVAEEMIDLYKRVTANQKGRLE
jgi:PTS system cellobiose-specific IIA component